MASIGHVLFGLAVARAHRASNSASRLGHNDAARAGHSDASGARRSFRVRAGAVTGAVAFAALAMLPDLDVIGFKLGVAYADTFGHRGAFHSIVVGVVAGLVLSLPLARLLRAPRVATAVAAVVAAVSHGVFDMLTDGGLGVAALWPFTSERFFLPWRPIPVAPIGAAFLSTRGLYCAGVELILFAPFLAFTVLFRGRRVRA